MTKPHGEVRFIALRGGFEDLPSQRYGLTTRKDSCGSGGEIYNFYSLKVNFRVYGKYRKFDLLIMYHTKGFVRERGESNFS